MATPKKNAALRMTSAEFEAMAIEAMGQKPGVTLELNDGAEIYIPHPAVLDDDRIPEISRVQNSEDLDEEEFVDDVGRTQTRRIEFIDGKPAPAFAIRMARAILGDEEFDRFRAAGGKSTLVMLAWEFLTRDENKKDGDRGTDPKPSTSPAS